MFGGTGKGISFVWLCCNYCSVLNKSNKMMVLKHLRLGTKVKQLRQAKE